MILTVDVTYDGNDLNLIQVFSPLLERLIADQESRGEREKVAVNILFDSQCVAILLCDQ